jgi:carboxymethylenebutenolidase
MTDRHFEISRRDFVRGALGSGFAAAVRPVAAQAIRTDSAGLAVGEVWIPAGDIKLPAYRAMPAQGAGALATVLVVSEIFGVHEHIADIARRFAKRGYLAIAPELFVRQGDAQSYGEVSKLVAEVIAKVPDAQVLRDLDACADWAAHNGGDPGRLGITGFCWGGRIVWLYAAHSAALKAGVAWYGRLAGAASALTPKQPADVAAELRAPVLGLYGGKDQGIPLASVEQMQAALAQGGAAAKASRLHVYAEAGHAFNADYRPSYAKGAAEDGWKRCLDWFAAHGVAAF